MVCPVIKPTEPRCNTYMEKLREDSSKMPLMKRLREEIRRIFTPVDVDFFTVVPTATVATAIKVYSSKWPNEVW